MRSFSHRRRCSHRHRHSHRPGPALLRRRSHDPRDATGDGRGRATSRELVQQSLTRIATYEERLNAVLAVNAHALEQADALDRERKAGKVRGPLHGVPIALKDNIHTTDMPTTGGALAFEGYVPPYEATVTRLLREAGAVIIAKTVMTELANWVAGGPTPMPTNYSALGRLRAKPVRPAARSARGDQRRTAGAGDRRVELRHRHRRQLLGRQRRHRDIGLDPQPGESDDAGGDQADGGTHQPLRHHPHHGRPGHGRPDGTHGDRRGDPARRARRHRRPIPTTRRPGDASRRRVATTRPF